jgi:hypothetical protein
MGGRDSCRDLRLCSSYRVLLVDDELTSGVLPRSHHPIIAGCVLLFTLMTTAAAWSIAML